jgi:hypothetical protein
MVRSIGSGMSLEEFGRHFVEFVRAHESWAVPNAFALAFAESLAFVSLILPSWAALVGIGALMKTGDLEFVLVWIAAAIGAALGDWLSYWIGTNLGTRSLERGHSRTNPACCFEAKPSLRIGEAWQSSWGGSLGVRACRCGYLGHALLAVPACKLQFRLCVGSGPSGARRYRRHDFHLAMGPCIWKVLNVKNQQQNTIYHDVHSRSAAHQ